MRPLGIETGGLSRRGAVAVNHTQSHFVLRDNKQLCRVRLSESNPSLVFGLAAPLNSEVTVLNQVKK